jgi:hypothetical protein
MKRSVASLVAGLLDFFWGAFLTSFCLRLPLLAMTVFVSALVLGVLGQGFGLPDLVYHDFTLKQFCNGISIGLLFISTLLVGFLLWNSDLSRQSELLGSQETHRFPRNTDVNVQVPSEKVSTPRRNWVPAAAILACICGSGLALLNPNILQPDFQRFVPWLAFALVIAGAGTLLAFRMVRSTIKPLSGQEKPLSLTDPIRWPKTVQDRPFLAYSCGILICFAATVLLISMAMTIIPSFASILGSSPSVALPSQEDSTAGTHIPLFVGIIDSALLIWVMLSFALWNKIARLERPVFRLIANLHRKLKKTSDEPAPPGLEQSLTAKTEKEFDVWETIPSENTRFYLFQVLVALGALVSFLLVMAPIASRFKSWPLAIVPGIGVFITLLTFCRYLCPKQWRRLAKAIADNTHMPNDRDYRYHSAAALIFGVSTAYFLTINEIPRCASPVTVGCFFLFVLITGYGLISYVVHRALPILICGLALLFLIGGIDRYKFRFDGLPQDKHYYRPDYTIPALPQHEFAEGVPAAELLDLVQDAKHDAGLQNALDDLLVKLEAQPQNRRELLDKINELKQNAEHNRIRPLIDPRPDDQLSEHRGDRRRLLSPKDLRNHADATEANRRRRPIVLISVSGGGLRAAVWTLAVLQKLEREFALRGLDFPARARLICGASGGMLGAAYYVATLPDRNTRLETIQAIQAARLRNDGPFQPERWTEMTGHLARLEHDFLTPIVKRAVYNDIPGLFSPFPNLSDRGKALEEAWRDELGTASPMYGKAGVGALDLSFADLRDREADGDCPSLVFSPMMIEDGRRLLISNLDLRYVAANTGSRIDFAGPVKNGNIPYSIEALELFRMFPEAKRTFKLSTAVRMSASFPYFSPAVSLPTIPKRRIVDAGYYDNFGVSLAASWLFSNRNAEWIEANASRIVLIQIRASVSESERILKKVPREDDDLVERSFEELVSPPEGLYNGLFAAASFRNDGQLELLSAYTRSNSAKRARRKFEREVRHELNTNLQNDDDVKHICDQIEKSLDDWLQTPSARRVGDALKEILDGKVASANSIEAVHQAFKAYIGSRLHPEDSQRIRYFTTATFECTGKAALSWYLSEADRKKIATAIGDENIKHAIASMIDWWQIKGGGFKRVAKLLP